jgi:hypothetical protein
MHQKNKKYCGKETTKSRVESSIAHLNDLKPDGFEIRLGQLFKDCTVRMLHHQEGFTDMKPLQNRTIVVQYGQIILGWGWREK